MARIPRRGLLGLGLAFGVAFATAELLLRVAGALQVPIPQNLGNALYSVYGIFPGGIYFVDEPTGMNFLRPDFETRAHWGGRWWRHATDGRGFRNPPGVEPRVLLLGDSMIYGHGVDEEDTVGHALRTVHGWKAYNMARQGDCLYQQYVLLRLHLPRLQPERVVLFAFANDLQDLTVYRSDAQIREAPELQLDETALARRVGRARSDFSWGQQAHRSKVLRLLAMLASGESAAEATDPRPVETGRPPLLAGYYDRILGDLARRAEGVGARLELVLIDHPMPALDEGEARLGELLEAASRRHGLPYRSTGTLLHGCPACLLPDDGHLTGEGARRIAAFVADR